MLLETERLFLRELELQDAGFIIDLLNSPSWLQFIGDRNVHTVAEAEHYLSNGPIKSYRQNGFGLWLAGVSSTNVSIGICGLIRREGLEHVDIGFALLPAFEGKGYAKEIATATLQYAKKILPLEEIVAITSNDNLRSIQLLNKIGLYFKSEVILPGEEKPVMLFSMPKQH